MIYIAYGSNMSTEQMARRCPNASIVGKTTMNGYRLTFQGRFHGAHANIIKEEGSTVPVLVWDITQEDEAELDFYEGVKGGYYYKDYIEVEVNGKKETGLVYIMNPKQPYNSPTLSYFCGIESAYYALKIDREPLENALLYAHNHEMQPVEEGETK